ncbi:MAG: hypothetical protein PHI24_13520, partial [Desulfitobacteriaceae bacterium]|nr:hypothetical protein [Desulfitobacteriaceae bacterium]
EQFSILYNPNGNIRCKTDISVYSPFAFQYSPTKPHAITQVYDPTDEYLEFVEGQNQHIGYNAFDKTDYIEQANKRIEFVYGPDLSRKIMKTYENEGGNSVLKKTKYYILGNTEIEVEYPTGKTRTLNYIGGKAILEQTSTEEKLYYLHKDYQGTTLAITDESGDVVQRYAYDPWGRRRQPGSWHNLTASEIEQENFLFARGYTGHEHLDAFGLINMNGRMYDPLLGRMLSPDNYVQAPDNSQNFNRYSYALNNPLVYTDPSGEWVHLVIGGIIGGIQGYMIGNQAGLTGWELVGTTLAGAGIGSLSGGVGTSVAASSGVVAGAVVGGAISGAGMGLTTGVANGQDFGTTLGMTIGGGFQGGILGLAGGTVGGAIGGGWGALAGGATAGGLGTWMSGGSGEDILKGAALGGVMGLGVYHASLAYSYHASGIKGTGLKYNQYARMMRLTQRSMFWNREGKFIPNSDGGFNVNALGDRNNTVSSNVPGDYENALFDYHTHQEYGYDRFSNIQDAIAAGVDPSRTDVTTRQALTLYANRGRIDPMTMYLGTREGNMHYWTHYGVQGTLNYNFSHVFTPFNLLWSMSLIR